jgi:hypothetical protein
MGTIITSISQTRRLKLREENLNYQVPQSHPLGVHSHLCGEQVPAPWSLYLDGTVDGH